MATPYPERIDALVIGGTGFMGRHTVQALLDVHASVEIITRGQSDNPWGTRVPQTVCDRQEACLEMKLQQKFWDVVVDFPIFTARDAVAIIRSSRWIRHYIFPSSDDVYMVCNRTLFSYGSDGGVLEESAIRPTNSTAAVKLNKWDSYGNGKKQLEERFAASALNFTALRLPDVWGSYESTGRFVTFLRSLEKGRSIGLHIDTGNPVFVTPSCGESFRPGFVFAKDVARIILLLLRKGPQQQPLNVAVAESPTFRETVIETYHVLKNMSSCRSIGELVFEKGKEVPLLSTDIGHLDIGRARTLGFTPTPWRQGWAETVRALFNASMNDTIAASELAKCVNHCKPTCFCEPTAAAEIYLV